MLVNCFLLVINSDNEVKLYDLVDVFLTYHIM